MALIICPECGKEISDRSTQCIHCGFPLGEAEKTLVSPSTPANSIPEECKEINAAHSDSTADSPSPTSQDSVAESNSLASIEASTPENKKPKAQKPIIISLVAIITIAGIGCGAYFGTAQLRQYKKAEQLQQSGNYEDAILAYSEISDYKDAADKINKCKYAIAQSYADDGSYDDAITMYEEIQNYGDSATKLLECKYTIAENYMADGSYNEAITMYEGIADYKDSATKILECKYTIAADYQTSANYKAAIDQYSEIQDYNDTAVQICACYYELGVIEYNNGHYSEAIDFFSQTNGYSDSEELMNSSRYTIAVGLMDNRDFEEAITYFEQIPNYQDAAELQNKCAFYLTVDGQFILALSDGLNSRWDISSNSSDEEASDIVAYRRKLIQCEYEYLEPFKDVVFDNETLGTMATSYITYLEDSSTALDYYNVDYSSFVDRWDAAYNGRTLLIRSFAQYYELQISEENQSVLDEFIAGASALDEKASVEDQIDLMLEAAKDTLTLESNDYGFRTYSVKITNTTEKTFDNFFVEAKVYKDGVIYETIYGSSVNDFAPGQTARFEFYVDYELEYYDLGATFYY